MRTSSVRCCLAAVVLAGSALCAWAETGVTNVITYTTNVAGFYYVGNTGPFNGLIITNGGRLVDVTGEIGANSGASNNFAIVTGAGSVWSNSSVLVVGESGANNQLTIADGGQVFDTLGGSVGDLTQNASNNTVTVTGAGSVWYNSVELKVGGGGTANHLIITNGGRVVANNDVYISAANPSNTVLVTGNGSVFRIGNILYVGCNGDANQLTLLNSGLVVNATAYIGYGIGYESVPASNNVVTVSGSGSIWSNNNLYVGYVGIANRLILTNGGLVVVTNTACVGFTNGANNQISLNGGALDAQQLLLTNNTASATNGLIAFNSGTLTTRGGARIIAPGDFIIGNTPGQTPVWNILGGTNSVQFTILGPATSLGSVAGAAGRVTVSGADAVWTNADVLVVGFAGTGSQLTITNGGHAVNDSGFVGYNASASNNAATVTGSGSVWNNDSLTIGIYGVGNQLTILNSGLVVSTEGYLGRYASATSNAVTVTGTGSVWSNANYLWIGEQGSGNQLTIRDDGWVVNLNGYVGRNGGASNTVTVSGDGALWRNATNLYVGYNGVGNQLTITNGGQVKDIKGDIGYDGTGSRGLVTGAGSLWTNSDSFVVGDRGDNNSLTIANSGQVVNAVGYIGDTSTANNNTALVTGAGSTWRNTSVLRVGNNGSSNQLTIQSGGVVRDNLGIIGDQAGSHDNAVLVTGTGSGWRHLDEVNVGQFGFANQLTIQDGGVVANTYGYIGKYASASNNAVTVTGAGSVWTNSGELYIGGIASGNQLTIADGGQVVSPLGSLGGDVNANNNSVTVTGNGSVWANRGSVYVGEYGSGNQLTVANGGTVLATNVTLGTISGSTGNVLTVSSGNLYATNAAATGTLDVRRGTFIFNAGTVVADRFLANNGTNSIVQFNGGTLRVGSGTVSNGSVFSVGGTLIVQSGTLTTANGLTIQNNAALQATGGGIIESWGAVTNNGVIDVIYGNTNFHSTFINNGIVLTADGDPDGDGMSNLKESQAGTSPTNSASCLRVTDIWSEGNDVWITWTAVGGKSYVVQTNSVPGNGFADFSSAIYVPVIGESVTNHVHTGGATNSSALFYRVRLVP